MRRFLDIWWRCTALVAVMLWSLALAIAAPFWNPLLGSLITCAILGAWLAMFL